MYIREYAARLCNRGFLLWTASGGRAGEEDGQESREDGRDVGGIPYFPDHKSAAWEKTLISRGVPVKDEGIEVDGDFVEKRNLGKFKEEGLLNLLL